MFVSVKYKIDETHFGERSYTYHTELPLHNGELVIAPTARNPKQIAVVCGIKMPQPSFACREITEMAPKGEAEKDA